MNDDAVVLRRVAYRDADVIVGLLTREHGRISALARAARRSRRRFGAALDMFTVSRAELSDRRRGDLFTLSSAAVVESFADLAVDVATFAHASYVTELVRELTPAEEPEPVLFALLVDMFRTLRARGATAMALRAFELALLDEIGLAPVFDACVSCGDRDLDTGAIVDPARGGAVCARCAATSRGRTRPLSAEARAVIVAAQRAESFEAAAASGDLEGAAEARDVVLAIVLGHVGKPLRSIEFIAKLGGGPGSAP